MTIEYRGYTAKVELDLETERLVGRVIGIRDAIVFHSETAAGLVNEFRASVDDYLDFCRERGIEPGKPYSGRFSLRVAPELHRRVEEAAAAEDVSMNDWVKAAIESRLDRSAAAFVSFAHWWPAVDDPQDVVIEGFGDWKRSGEPRRLGLAGMLGKA